MKSTPALINSWIDEYHQGTRYGMEGKILIDEQSTFQRITLIESKRYGIALLLDGCWMTAEAQERHYHECLVHPALCSAKSINKILDYSKVFEFLASYFDYVTINVSSPNTQNLRDLQKPENLEKILINIWHLYLKLKEFHYIIDPFLSRNHYRMSSATAS